jgi:hypothetical protein
MRGGFSLPVPTQSGSFSIPAMAPLTEAPIISSLDVKTPETGELWDQSLRLTEIIAG